MRDNATRAAGSSAKACSVESTTHEVIEAKLLHALADTDKVALACAKKRVDKRRSKLV